MSNLETAREQALRMPERWGLSKAPTLFDFAGGLSAAVLEAQPGEVWSHAGDAHIVSLVVQGESHHRLWHDGKQLLDGFLPAPSVNFVVAGVTPRAVISDSLKVLHVYVPAKLLVGQAERVGCHRAKELALINPLYESDPSLMAILMAILQAMHSRGGAQRLWLDSLGSALGARMIQRWSNLAGHADGETARHQGGLAHAQFRRVRERMTDDLTREPYLTELAELAGLSPNHFCRAFTATTGMPPHRWLMQRRIERARELLNDPRLTVAQVASQIGYEDPSYFARLFKRYVGATPSGYRRRDQ